MAVKTLQTRLLSLDYAFEHKTLLSPIIPLSLEASPATSSGETRPDRETKFPFTKLDLVQKLSRDRIIECRTLNKKLMVCLGGNKHPRIVPQEPFEYFKRLFTPW